MLGWVSGYTSITRRASRLAIPDLAVNSLIISGLSATSLKSTNGRVKLEPCVIQAFVSLITHNLSGQEKLMVDRSVTNLWDVSPKVTLKLPVQSITA